MPPARPFATVIAASFWLMGHTAKACSTKLSSLIVFVLPICGDSMFCHLDTHLVAIGDMAVIFHALCDRFF
jgi:hypothetical protein